MTGVYKFVQFSTHSFQHRHWFKGPWTPKLTYTFYPFSWKCRIFW